MAEQEVCTQENKSALMVHDEGEYQMLFDSARFAQAWRVAKLFSESKLVPAHFQGSPQSVFIVLHLATRMNLDPFTAMQKIYVISGKPGIEAQLVIALVNARGPFRGPIQFKEEGEGDNRKWTAFAIHDKTGELCEATVTWAMVKAEGWAGKSGSKWMTMPSMMGRYRSATFLARLFCPEVILGLSTVDELQDMDIIEVESSVVPAIAPPKETKTESIKDELKTRRVRSHKAPESSQDAPASDPAPEPAPRPEGAAEATTESQGPDLAELLKTLEGKGWPEAKIKIKYPHWDTWTEAEKVKVLADMAAEA